MKIYMVLIVIIIFLAGSCNDNHQLPGGSGVIEAVDAVISAETGGRLLAVNFNEGEMIKNGDTIAVIDTTALILKQNQLFALQETADIQIDMARIGREQADYNLTLAKKEFDRVAALIKTGSANQQQYDQAENAFNQAQLARKKAAAAADAALSEKNRITAEINILRKSINDCTPTAPLSGKIIQRYIEPGELISPGKPLIKIASLDTVWVKIYLPPADLTRLKLGSPATIDPEDGQNIPVSGFISWISSEAEFTPKNIQTKEARADLVYAVKITISNENERLKIGMPVSVLIGE